MLWLALHLPQLSLDIITRSQETTLRPTVIFTQRGNQQYIHTANTIAQDAGIHAGRTLAAALSLVDNLHTQAHNLESEQQALEQLALWAQQFTPRVCLTPPDHLLLEIAGSLNLFHGLAALHTRIKQDIIALGYQAQTAIAPTPLAATFLARAAIDSPITEHAMLAKRLSPLPLSVLNYPEKKCTQLQGVGLKTLGDCLALPRDGINHRFGKQLLEDLDKALGKYPDPRKPYEAPLQFKSQILLPEPVDNTEPLLFLLQRLLIELKGFLRGHGSGAQALTLELLHPHQPPTSITLGLLTPNRDTHHFLELWREKLERLQLNGPVEGLQLSADKLQALQESNLDLLQDKPSKEQDLKHFIERLHNRLGPTAVRSLASSAEYRPEKAWRYAHNKQKPSPPIPRPFWLLETPQPINATPLRLLHGPERIESGWWDGDDIRRNYYIAEDVQAQRLWIFQTINHPSQWFLHGIFA